MGLCQQPQVVPKWFPTGYEILDLSREENKISQTVCCMLENQNEEYLLFKIADYETTGQLASLAIEKDGRKVETYINKDQRFYIMGNLETTVLTWSADTWCAIIDGAISVEDARAMIDSIGG